MATVHLIDFTGKGRPDEEWHAADVLMFTKSTRLNMTPGLMANIKSMHAGDKQRELQYMANTIQSSWEFVDVTFLIEGVTRAVAQQITRTRTASYAMQSQRVNDLSDIDVLNPFGDDGATHESVLFTAAVNDCRRTYGDLIAGGAKKEDARGIMPMNTRCNLVAKYNLRSLVDVMKARRSMRAQGEYADIAIQMQAAVLHVWPWAAPFFADKQAAALAMLEQAAKDVGITVGSGPGWEIAKAIDLIRKG